MREHRRTVALWVAASILLATTTLVAPVSATELDAVGNYIIGGLPGGGSDYGDMCGSCPEPRVDTGVDFQGNDLITYGPAFYGADDAIRRLQACGVVEIVSLVPPPGWGFDIAFDSMRSLYVVTDVDPSQIHQYDLSGNRVYSWVPLHGPVGVTYDTTRDVYWISGYPDIVYAMDPDTGAIGEQYPVPAGSRIAGAGYDADNDAIVYHGRDQAKGYWMSAKDGSLLGSYDVPFGGVNNGQGCGVDPITHSVWLSHHELPDIFCIEGLTGPISVEASSWGQLKSHFR